MIAALAQMHWLRPDWLWALAALPVLAWWWQRRRSRGSIWRQAVDPHLLPHLLEARGGSRTWVAPAIAGLAFIMAVLALAGPTLHETQQPLWAQESPLVVAVDLSSASLAADMPPSRVAQMRAKIGSLLTGRQDGQVGLVAWSGEAFTVAPLTSEGANVALFIDALDPEVMPIDGQRADKAIAWSARLLVQAGFQHGTVLLLTDHATAPALEAAARVHTRGYTVSVLGIGTADGAPYRNADGEIVVARRDDASLQQLAAAGGGRYAPLSSDNADLAALGVLDPRDGTTGNAGGAESDNSVTTWQDDGYWLLLPLMVLALFAFRRGAPVLLLVVCLWLPGRGVHAAELWQRPDQRAHKTMEEAAGAYRRGDFTDAAGLYGDLDNAEANYNRGNALARQGNYAEALEAYDKALQTVPDMADAIANRQAVEAAMKRQPPSGQSGDGSGQDDSESGQGDDGSSQDGERDPDGEASDEERDADTQPRDEPADNSSDADDKSAEQSAGADGERHEKSPSPDSAEDAGESDDTDAPDAEAQQEADEAQRERMREALQQGRQDAQEEAGSASEVEGGPESADDRERRIANEAWLRRIPDDPGGLLRRKFRIEYERRQREGSTQ